MKFVFVLLASASAIRINDDTVYPLWSGHKDDLEHEGRRPYSPSDSWEAADEHADHFKAWKQWGREQTKNKSNSTNATKSETSCFYGQDQCNMVDVPTTKSAAAAKEAWKKRQRGDDEE